jgi:hypothetical protein
VFLFISGSFFAARFLPLAKPRIAAVFTLVGERVYSHCSRGAPRAASPRRSFVSRIPSLVANICTDSRSFLFLSLLFYPSVLREIYRDARRFGRRSRRLL